MKTLSALFLTLILTTAAIAQPPAGQKPPAGQGTPAQGAPAQTPPGAKPTGQGQGAPQAPPAIGRAYGKVTDSAGQPMAQASVLLLKAVTDPTTKKRKLVLMKGTETKANGEFNFEDLPIVTPMVARISATGYKSQDVNVMIVPAQAAAKPGSKDNSNPLGNLPSFDKDLGAIKLTGDIKELGAVTVKASTPTMKLELDKKVFNVEKNITSTGGTAVDVMRNVPSVNVDIDGNVTLRGANPTIFVDGRPTTLSLDQIPADAIESVEVMTNPSAKYDASGGGSGILNIILKKNRKKGYNGSITGGIDSHGAPNALAGINVRSGKVNLSVNGMYNAMNGRTIGNTDRNTFLDTTSHLLQDDEQRNKGHFMFGQVGLDWFINNRTTISASYLKVHGNFKPTDVSNIETREYVNNNPSPVSDIYSLRNSTSDRTFDVNGVQGGLKHLFAKEGHQLTADASHFWVTSHSTALNVTNYFKGVPNSFNTYQETVGTADPSFWTFQTDYTNPLTKKTKLEAGLRASIQKLDNYNNTYFRDSIGNAFPSPFGLSDYTSTSDVYAAYVNLTSGWGNFSYSAGLRAESSRYSGDLRNTKQHFSNKYPISLFPSLFLSEKLKGNQEVQFSATRKINRPGFFQLIPYTDYSDSLNITRGNPDLVPEFTNSFELSYMKTFPHNNTVLVSGYYKHTSNLITRYQDSGQNPIGKPVLINTYENANSAYTVGGEVTGTVNITRWWDASLNVNIYQSHINTDNLKQLSQDAIWSWFGKLNTNFKLPANFSIQLTAVYQSKTNIPANQQQNQFGPPGSTTQSSSQGFIRPFGGVDMAIKKSFLKNNAASITLSMSDMFRTRWSKQYSSSAVFNQEYDRLKDPQLFRAVFAYRFGKMDLNLFKRKNMNSQGMGDAGSALQ